MHRRRTPLRFPLHVKFWVFFLFCGLFCGPPKTCFSDEIDAPEGAISKRKTVALQRQFQQHVAQGQTLFQAGDFPNAIQEYLSAYALHPQTLLLFNVAQSYRMEGKPEKALHYYEEFMRKDPKHALVPECEAQARAMRTQIEADQVAAEKRAAERVAQEKGAEADRQAQARAQEAERLEQDKRLLEQKIIEERRAADALKRQPVYKKKWFWIVLGGAVVTAGAVGIIVWKTRPPEVSVDEGPYLFTFPN